MESSAALPHAARELLLKGGGCAVNFECAPELCAPLRAELARSGRSVGFVRADEGFYDRMDTAAYLRLFERMAGTRGMADAALAAMGLEDARRTPLRRLTPAQRRRLSIAREIVRAPEVFYIEEPLAGQDAEGCRRILEWMDGVPSTGRCCIAATASTRTVYLLPGERYHLDGNGLERLEAAEESAAQGTAVEKIPAKAGETLLLFNPSDIDFAESASGAQRPGRRIRLRAHAGGAVCPAGTLRLFSLPPLLPCEHAEGTGGGALDAQQLRAAAGERAGIRCAAQQGPH